MNLTNAVTLRQKVSQLFVVRASGHIYDIQRDFPQWELTNKELRSLLKEGVGGVILVGGSAWELKSRCKILREWAGNPILICADIEEGLGQRFEGGTSLVPPISLGQIYKKDSQRALQLAKEYGHCIGYQARSCGLNWVLAPVCDINTNPDNPVINVRAWGEDPSIVSHLIAAFQRGLDLEGVLSCAKHFPGHGDTNVDSHIGLPTINHKLKRLEECEFLPFQSAIASGVDSVMIGHLLLPNLDYQYPATLSKLIITDLLRKKLGFDGLVVTDALVMDAITRTYGPGQAAVMAFEAGADLIMMPESIELALQALCDSFQSGRLSLDSLDKALNRRYELLAKLTDSYCVTDQNPLTFHNQELERESDHSLSLNLINSSLEINHPRSIPSTSLGVNLVRIDGPFLGKSLINSSPALCIPEQAGYRTCLFHPKGISPWSNDKDSPLVLERLPEGLVLLQIFTRGNPFQGDLHQNEPWPSVVRQLQRHKLLAGLVVYGSPYLWNDLSQSLDKSIPSAYSPGNFLEVQRKLLNALFGSSAIKNSTSFSDLKQFTD